MKSCEEMTRDVLRRRDTYIKERRKRIRTAVAGVSCLCIAAAIGVGAWYGGAFSKGTAPLPTGAVPARSGIVPASDSGNSVTVGGEEKQSALQDADGINYTVGVSGAMQDMNGTATAENMVQMVSGYGENDGEASYKAPENGTVGYSIPLSGAMEEYEDGVLYRVYVDLFRDEGLLPPGGGEVQAEADRLAGLGYTVAMETYTAGDETHYAFTLHASLEQLESFPVSEGRGYMFFLYDERVFPDEVWETDPAEHSGFADAPAAAMPDDTGEIKPLGEGWGGCFYTAEDGKWHIWLTENTEASQKAVFRLNPALSADNTVFLTAKHSLAYLQRLLADISALMGTDELPTVTSAWLSEHLNCVEVAVRVGDDVSLAALARLDTEGGAVKTVFSDTQFVTAVEEYGYEDIEE